MVVKSLLRSRTAFLSLAVTATVLLGLYAATHPVLPRPKGSPEARAVKSEYERTSTLKGPEAERRLEGLVARSKDSLDKDVQDVVATARMKLGYLAAERGDWRGAETVMRTAADEYRGSGQSVEGFGKLDEQAAYQAIVSVQASGDTKRSIKEYVRYLQDRPYSPLCYAVYDRLCKLDPRNAPSYERLLARATSKATEKKSLDEAQCGPKVLARLLLLKDGRRMSLEEASKLCGTTKEGTSMEALASACKAVGHKATGVLLNRRDFASVRLPAVWLWNGHYVLLSETDGATYRFYDPMDDSERSVRLPRSDDAEFQAVVLAID
ncbi:MAG: hypothetical protein JSS66_09170 [Armatimonadetes bacterium]|nr:hypothetical protein [Armatimonadota bacterium]